MLSSHMGTPIEYHAYQAACVLLPQPWHQYLLRLVLSATLPHMTYLCNKKTFQIFLLLLGFGLVAYILLWVFLPEWEAVPSDYEAITGD